MGSHGKKHFSHHHVLISLKFDEATQAVCKACNLLIISENFHSCTSCKFYIHDVCLNAPRSLEHPSHPSHPLALLPTPTYPHQSYTCNACGYDGNGISLSCPNCEFDLHVQCASLPKTLVLETHPHELKLRFDSPHEDKNSVFSCDLCCGAMKRDRWLYYCEICSFKVDLECATSENHSKEQPNEALKGKQESKETSEEPAIKVDRHLEMLQRHLAQKAKLKELKKAMVDLEWVTYCREQNYY